MYTINTTKLLLKIDKRLFFLITPNNMSNYRLPNIDPVLASVIDGKGKICIKTEEQFKKYREFIEEIKRMR